VTVPLHHLEIQGPIDDDGDRVVLILSGDIDLQTAPDLRDQIKAAAAPGAPVVIDLRDVRFVDSPGLGTLIYCGRALEATGSKLVLRAPQGHVRDLFDLVSLHALFTIE
jgi:anti-sigma B factor antagonist